ncbi:Murein DD-endopeptidase MepM [Ascidiaceihabitans donghaensis]|uniref:Murein DD-endopeptidase MepM n=1 Tax=Ascidiaceihabitans donghaensis TaxID=1510460 RepID=A0A2R8BD43_9RHOB|nr:M23 family metallopeptidase [Ascidiaceihabitans donghaensis]SPH20995.1 Murein DD-endopeptidase MepM [Ascidiaceihabitans donghaensis]
MTTILARFLAAGIASALTVLLGVYFIVEMSVGTIHRRIDDTNANLQNLREEIRREIDYRISNAVQELGRLPPTDFQDVVMRSVQESKVVLRETEEGGNNQMTLTIQYDGVGGVPVAKYDTVKDVVFYLYGDSYYDEFGRPEHQEEQMIRLATPVRGSFRFASGFGPRWGRMHNGIDFAAVEGTPIYAAANGIVTMAGWKSGYGKLIKIDHENGFETWYAHLSSVDVTVGEMVRTDEQIGAMGSTGRSTGTHLHFEVRLDGDPVNPMTFLNNTPSRQTPQQLIGAELASFLNFIEVTRLKPIANNAFFRKEQT